MSREMENLVNLLKSRPNQVLINDSGTTALMLVGSEEKLMVIMSLKKNFHEMTEAEFNEFIQDLLK
jgi:hypothetical protein